VIEIYNGCSMGEKQVDEDCADGTKAEEAWHHASR
jgi:hypothetical protein